MNLAERISQIAGGSGLALGLAGAAAPRTFGRAFGFSVTDAETAHVTRLFGTRTAALGALGLLGSSGPQRRQFLGTVAAMGLADVVFGLRASDIPPRGKLLSTVASGVFAAAAAAALAANE